MLYRLFNIPKIICPPTHSSLSISLSVFDCRLQPLLSSSLSSRLSPSLLAERASSFCSTAGPDRASHRADGNEKDKLSTPPPPTPPPPHDHTLSSPLFPPSIHPSISMPLPPTHKQILSIKFTPRTHAIVCSLLFSLQSQSDLVSLPTLHPSLCFTLHMPSSCHFSPVLKLVTKSDLTVTNCIKHQTYSNVQ